MNSKTAEVIYPNSSTASNDIRYLTGFLAPDPFLFICHNKKKILITSIMEKGRAVDISGPDTTVLTCSDVGLSKNKTNSFDLQLYAFAKKEDIREFYVGHDFPIGIAESLKKKGVKISIRNNNVSRKRRIKKQKEIDHITYSQRASAKVMRMAIKIIHDAKIGKNSNLIYQGGFLTSEKVKEIVQKELLVLGCSGTDVIVAGGEQAVDPHERGFGALFAHEAIIIDIFPRHEESGYWGDMTRTVCRGAPPAQLKKIYQAVFDAQKAALLMVKPGACADSIHKMVQQYFKERGFVNQSIRGKPAGFIHGTGHGVGLDIHEAPRIGFSGDKLKKGDVITIEPGLYYPGVGGVRIEDTVLVCEGGFKTLALCHKKFIN